MNTEGMIHEVELARMTSSSARESSSLNTFCFRDTFSGVHSYTHTHTHTHTVDTAVCVHKGLAIHHLT